MSQNKQKLFTVQPDFHYGIYTGTSSDGLPMMVTHGIRSKVYVVIYFDQQGAMLRYDEIPPIVVEYDRTASQPENEKRRDVSLRATLFSIGLHNIEAIQVQRFLIPEHAIGIRQYPDSLQRFLKEDIEYSPEDIAALEVAKAQIKSQYPDCMYNGFSVADLSGYTQQEDADHLELFQDWTARGDFVLWAQNDFWCNSDGYIHSS